jgi:hypothetical protein
LKHLNSGDQVITRHEPEEASMSAEPATSQASASPLDSHASPVAGSARRPGRAIAAMIVGIIAVLCILIPIAGVILGIVALVLGSSARSDIGTGGNGYAQAKAGFILGIVAIAGSIVMWVVSAIILSS